VSLHIDNRDVQWNRIPSSFREAVERGGADPSHRYRDDGACEEVDAVHRLMLCVLVTAHTIARAAAAGSARPPGCDSVAVDALVATAKRDLPKFQRAVQHPSNIGAVAGLCKSTTRILYRERARSKTTALRTADMSDVLTEAAAGEIITLADNRGTRGLLLLAQDELDSLAASKLIPAEAATLRDVVALLSQFQRYAFACGDAQKSAYNLYGLEGNKAARNTLAGLLLAVFPPPSGVPAAACVDTADMLDGEAGMTTFFTALRERCQGADEARWNRLYTYGYLFCGGYTSAAKGQGCEPLVKLQLALIGAIADAHGWSPSEAQVRLLPAAMRRLRPLETLGALSAAAGTGIHIATTPAVATLRLKLLHGSTAAALGLPPDADRAPCNLDLPATAFNALAVLDACAAAKTWHTRTQKDVLLPAPTGGRRMGERAKELRCTLRSLMGHGTPEDGTAPIGAQRLQALGRSLQLRPLGKDENQYSPHEAPVANKRDKGYKAATCKRLVQQAGWLFKIGGVLPETHAPATTAPVGRAEGHPAAARSTCTIVFPAPDAPLAAPHATSGAAVSTPSAASGPPPSSGPGAAKRRRVETAAVPCPATAVSSNAVSAVTAVPPTAVAAAAAAAAAAADAVTAEASAAAASSLAVHHVVVLQGSVIPHALPSLPQGLEMQRESEARKRMSASETTLFRQLWREGADDASFDVDVDEDDGCDDDEACGAAMGVFMHAFGAPGMHSTAIVPSE
jgi:hypothetical protein